MILLPQLFCVISRGFANLDYATSLVSSLPFSLPFGLEIGESSRLPMLICALAEVVALIGRALSIAAGADDAHIRRDKTFTFHVSK